MHRRLFELTGRARVRALIYGTKIHLDRVRWLILNRIAEHAQRTFRVHKAIFERSTANDSEGLCSAMRQHIDAVACT